jgi:hypothetical protein
MSCFQGGESVPCESRNNGERLIAEICVSKLDYSVRSYRRSFGMPDLAKVNKNVRDKELSKKQWARIYVLKECKCLNK